MSMCFGLIQSSRAKLTPSYSLIGRSTGAGALSIWTHNLGGIEILDYKSKGYTGKAIKAGAGVNGLEVETAAHKAGLFAVGGQCPVCYHRYFISFQTLIAALFIDCRTCRRVPARRRTLHGQLQARHGCRSSLGMGRCHY